MLNGEEQMQTPSVRYKKPGNAKTPAAGNQYETPKTYTIEEGIKSLTLRVQVKKPMKVNAVNRTPNVSPNINKNLEWICSYAGIEQNFVKNNNMKLLIKFFKKIRDNKRLTNLKSYYIKTMFLHQNDKCGPDYWQKSLAILFMEMFDVMLKHLCQHHLASFWHNDFNLFQRYKPQQIKAIYLVLRKTKTKIVTNLLNT